MTTPMITETNALFAATSQITPVITAQVKKKRPIVQLLDNWKNKLVTLATARKWAKLTQTAQAIAERYQIPAEFEIVGDAMPFRILKKKPAKMVVATRSSKMTKKTQKQESQPIAEPITAPITVATHLQKTIFVPNPSASLVDVVNYLLSDDSEQVPEFDNLYKWTHEPETKADILNHICQDIPELTSYTAERAFISAIKTVVQDSNKRDYEKTLFDLLPIDSVCESLEFTRLVCDEIKNIRAYFDDTCNPLIFATYRGRMDVENRFFWFSKLSEAIHMMPKDNKTVLFARDVKNSNDKIYKEYSFLDVNDFIRLISSNLNIYEVIPADVPVRLYFDLEQEGDELDCSANLEAFLYWISVQIKNTFGILLDIKQFNVLDSCRSGKLSYHVVCPSIVFANNADQKKFIKYLASIFAHDCPQAAQLSWKYTSKTGMRDEVTLKENTRHIFDPIPYGRNQCYRASNQSKIGRSHILKIMNSCDIEQTFVRIYNDKQKFVPVNVDSVPLVDSVPVSPATSVGSSSSNTMTPAAEFIGSKTLFNFYGLTMEQWADLPDVKKFLYVIPNENTSYEQWTTIGMALRSEGANKQDWIDWSRLNPSFVPGECDVFDTFNPNKGVGFGIGTLAFYARKAAPEFFKKQDKTRFKNLFSQLHTLNKDGFKVIEEETKFVSQDSNNIFEPCHSMVIHSYLGTGKTTALKSYVVDTIQKKNNVRILMISPRQSFAYFLEKEFAEFGLVNYLSAKKAADQGRFIISLESIHKLNSLQYDLVLLDECEEILANFTSETLAGKYWDSFQTLAAIINNATKVFYCDAFVTNRTLSLCKKLAADRPCVYLRNHTLPERAAQELTENDFLARVNADAIEGKKNFHVFSQLKHLKNQLASLPSEYVEKAEIYHSERDSANKKRLLAIDTHWRACSGVFISPQITVGVSYSEPNQFDTTYIKAGDSCSVRSIFQMSLRVRHTKTGQLFFSIPKAAYSGALDSSRMDTYKAYSDRMDKIGQTMAFYQHSEALRLVQYFNHIEKIVSGEFHRETFCEYLNMCGYKAQYLTADELKDMKSVKMHKMTQEQKKEEWAKIPTIDPQHATYKIEEIRDLERQNAATRLQSLEREKFFFLKVAASIGLVEECHAQVFWSIWMTPRGRHILDNIQSDSVGYSTTLQKEKAAENAQGLAEVYKTTAEKRRALRGLAAAMGLKNTYEGGQIITREQIKAGAKYFATNPGSFVLGFNLETDKLIKLNDPELPFSTLFYKVQGLFLELTGMQLKSSQVDTHTKTAIEYTTKIFGGLVLQEKEPNTDKVDDKVRIPTMDIIKLETNISTVPRQQQSSLFIHDILGILEHKKKQQETKTFFGQEFIPSEKKPTIIGAPLVVKKTIQMKLRLNKL